MKTYTDRTKKLYQCLKKQAKRNPKLMFFFFHMLFFLGPLTIE